ncbi:MAG: RNHCP domain-containing protein [Minisyncoccota bacterium]
MLRNSDAILFQRRKENFKCGYCGFQMTGNGYTNHCARCLYSKHVDVFPGDRMAKCQGLMEPVTVTASDAGYRLQHRCLCCGYVKNNKTDPRDSFEALLCLAKRLVHE